MNALPDEVERAALLGWKLVPATAAKTGRFRGYLNAATHDLDQLEAWSREYPGCCWKARPEGSGVWFLDVDVPGKDHASDGVAALLGLCDIHGPIPPRPYGRSPSGGFLLVFRDAGHPIAPGSAKPAPGLDVLSGRCCAMVAPSRRDGRAYRWVVAPWELAPPVAPQWLLDLVAPAPLPVRLRRPYTATRDRAERALRRSLDAIGAAGPGQRNSELLRRSTLLGGYVAGGLLGADAAMRELVGAGMAAGQTRAQSISTIRSGFRRGAVRPFDGDAR